VPVALIYDSGLDAYDLGEHHPLRSERVTGTIELLRVHTAEYLHAVRHAGPPVSAEAFAHGFDSPDNPVFAGMHEVSALIAGAGIVAMRAVLGGDFCRSFSIAGGLHHAHRDRAAGFCVYNDVAVAIADALAHDPTLRIAYIDIDAHHGDGVQEAFYSESRVLTFSVHESGRYLFPGTGFPEERGEGPGSGTAFNLPLPPGATDACYRLAFERAIAPAVRAFAPDLLVLQAGADAHHSDPLTSLGLALPGYRWLVEHIIALSDELTGGRIVAFGGGG